MSRQVSVGSRDPAGLHPSGIDVVVGSDPPPDEYREGFDIDPPILPPTIPSGPPPPTPRRTHPRSGVRAPSPVMAFLVGDPPPPPKTPPPKQRGAAPTRRQHVPISPPGDASTTTGFSSLSSSIHPRHEPRDRLMDENMMSFVDQKRREALAIYESPNLYMEEDNREPLPPKFQEFDPPSERYQQQNLQKPEENQQRFEQPMQHQSRNIVYTGTVDLDDHTLEPTSAMASPRSAVTEHHSNKRSGPRQNHKRTSSQESNDNPSSDFQLSNKASNKTKKVIPEDGNTSKKRRNRMSTGSAKTSKASEKRVRGGSVERGKRGEPERGEKKGFFRKIFGGGKKKASEGPATNVKLTKPEEHSPSKMSAKAPKAMHAAHTTAPDMPVLPPQKPGQSKVTDPSATEVEYNEPRRYLRSPEMQHAVSRVGLEADPSVRQIQLDTAPSDDPRELDLGMRLDTVTSGLTNDIEPDRRDVFFAHDEVSALTAPSAQSYSRRSVDPVESTATVTSGSSSEPVGRYWKSGEAGKAPNSASTPKTTSPVIDPFTEPFFREPDGESPLTTKKLSKVQSKLQVDVPETKDPMGETPPTKQNTSQMNEPSPRGWEGTPHDNEPSPRGWESPVTGLKDPMGSNISESSPKRRVAGFGCSESVSKPKLPPSSQKSTPVEVMREPSAFRDGSPYPLDPPLRVQKAVHEGRVQDAKTIVGILSQVSHKAPRGDRIAVEPPIPSRSLHAAREEAQPSTPSLIKSEPVAVRSAEPMHKENTENHAINMGSQEEVHSFKTSKSPLTNRTTPSKHAWSSEKAKVNSTRKIEPDSPDATGFLDDLFQEKPTSHKRPSIVRPVSINLIDPARKASVPKSPSSQTEVVAVHRTQRLSGSPKSSKAAPRSASKMAVANARETIPLPVQVPAGSPKAEEVLTKSILRRHHDLRGEEEEKKEQDHGKIFSESEDPSPISKLATSTAALSTAVIQNAKTVAYFRTLNGEPSPRHAWRSADLSDDEYSPAKAGMQGKAATNVKAATSKKRMIAVNSDEDAFDRFLSSSPAKCPPSTTSFISFGPASQAKAARLGVALSSNQTCASRSKPSKSRPVVPHKSSKLQLRGQQYGAHSPKSRKTARENFRRPLYLFRFNRDVRVTGAPLAFGLDLIRKKRIEDILNGYVVPVYKDKETKTKKPPPPPFQCLQQEEIKDPIQRAGRRLLSKAAVPIQSAARRYLAIREAETRAGANTVVQSYFRRWKCEAFLLAHKVTCIKIQAAIRSSLVRIEIEHRNYQATQIQKVVRGYIAAAYVYDTIYWVSKLQAAMRGKLARNHFAALKVCRQRSAVCLQAWRRGCLDRQKAIKRRVAASRIQAICRSYRARANYQVQVFEIVMVQCMLRRFLAQKEAETKRLVNMNAAARKIQATWRGFQGYTDYIFALVDILVLQRSMRKWLAKKRVNSMLQERAAVKIQAQWRRQTALIGMLYDLVHIIIVQSLVRRFLARKQIPQKRMEYSRKMQHQQMLDTAATKIQTAWRGFWGYSHFIIMQYEIIRLQAIIRGRAARILFSLKLGCCIMIQSAVRRYLASKKTYSMKLTRATFGAEVEGLRMKVACRKVQFWWRVVIECSKEKKAALIIERFFVMVKAEVDKEIVRQQEIERRESMKAKERQIKKQRSKLSTKSAPLPPAQQPQRKRGPSSDADERLLEKIWLNTVEEDHVNKKAHTPHNTSVKANMSMPADLNAGIGEGNRRSKSDPRPQQSPLHVSPSRSAPKPQQSPLRVSPNREGKPSLVKPKSPTMNLVMRHENDPSLRHEFDFRTRKEEALKASRRIQKSSKPPPSVMLAKCSSELSAITSPTIFTAGTSSRNTKEKRPTKSSKQPDLKPKHVNTLEDDLSLEESLLGEDIVETTQNQGKHLAPHQRSSKKHHFFSEESTNQSQHQQLERKQVNRRHSTSSIASEISYTLSEDASDAPSQIFSRKSTATTITRTTASRSTSLGRSPRSECYADLNVHQTVGKNGMHQKDGGDKYSMSTGTAAMKGKKLIESVRGNSGKKSVGSLSPRHGQIVVTNVPILSKDSRDNVEVEYGGGDQFGLI